MFNGAKSDRIKIGNTVMEYITFGKGDKTLVIIPGLSDGLKTVKGTAMTMALMYRKYAKEYKVFVFSRKNQLEEGYDTRHMARDLKEAMAEGGDYKNLVIDSMEKTYTEDYLKRKKYRWMYPVITRIGKPKDFNRFIIQAKA